MVNTAEILIRTVDDGASVTLKALVAQFDSLTTSAQRTGEGMTTGLTKVNTTAPQAEITHLKEIVDRLPVAAETAASGTTAGLSRISTAASAAEIERLRLLVTQLPASAVDAAGGVDTAMNRITALEARTSLKVLDDALKVLPGTAMSAATETTRSLATVKTQQPEGELTRLRAVITQLDPAAVAAAGGVDAAMKRVTTIEAQTAIKALDSQIKGLITGSETASGATNAALDRIHPVEATAAVDGLGKSILDLPKEALEAAAGTQGALDTVGTHFHDGITTVADWGKNLIDWAKKGAEAIGLIAVAEGGIDFAAIKTAATYQTTLTENRNNTLMTDQDAANMRSTTLGLAPTLGIDPNVLAQAFRQAFDLNNNASVTDIILKQAGMSAKSTGDNPEATATILAQLLHEYGLDKGGPNQEADATRVMGQAHITAASGKMTLADFSQNFGQISAWGANLGIPMDQLMAGFATMTAHGFDPATAATQTKDILPHLIKPSSGALGEAANLDKQVAASGQDDGTSIVSLFSAESISKLGISGTMEELHKKFDALHLDEAQQTEELLKLVPNMRGGAAAFTLLGQGADDYKKILGNLDNQSLTMNVTQESFNRTQETAAFKWDALKEKLQVFGIELGDKLLPIVTRFIGWLTDRLPAGATEVDKLATAFQTTALPALQRFGGWFTDTAIPAVERFAGAVKTWIVDTVVPTIGRLWDDAQPKLHQFAQWFTETGWPAIQKFAGGVQMFIEEQVLPAFHRFITDVVPILQQFIGKVRDIITQVSDLIHQHSAGIEDTIRVAWTVIVAVIKTAMPIIAEEVKRIIDIINTWMDIIGKVRDFIKAAWPEVQKTFIDLKATVLDWKDRLVEFFGNVKDKVLEIHDWIVEKWDFVRTKFDDLKATVLDWKDRFLEFLTNAKDKVTDIHDWIIAKWDLVKAKFDDLGEKVREWLAPGGKIGGFFDNLTSIFTRAEKMAHDIFGPGGSIGGFFDNIGGAAHDWFGPGGRIGSFFDNIGSAAHAIEETLRGIFGPGGTIGSYFDAVGTKIHDLLGPLQDIISKLGQIPGVGAIGNFLGGGSSGGSVTYGGGVYQPNVSYPGPNRTWQDGHGNIVAPPPGYASGTDFAPGGMAWVGERGPELLDLPRGAQVFSSDQSRRMATAAAPIINVYVTGSITTARGLAADVRTELLRMQRQGIDLGFN